MAADAFESPKQLIRHAREEIDDAEKLALAYFKANASRVVEPDHQARQDVHKIRLAGQLPAKVGLILKDASGALRDALDHAVYSAAVRLLGGAPSQTGFPFAKDANGVAGELDGKRLKGNPAELRPYLASLCPHEGGNDLLWGLNSIRNPNTHRFVVPMGTAGFAGDLGIGSGSFTGNTLLGYSRWDAAKQEIEFMRTGFGSAAHYQVQAAFEVAFEGTHALRGKPAIPTLREIAAEVERVVWGIEAETARIIRERGS